MAVTLLVKQVSLREHAWPHRRVVSFHGDSGQMQWEHTQEQVIDHLANLRFYYFFLKDGRAVRIVLDRTTEGEPFVKAETDGNMPGALLQLPLYSPGPTK